MSGINYLGVDVEVLQHDGLREGGLVVDTGAPAE